MTNSGKRASSVPLEGQFHLFDGEMRSIEVARRIEYPDGRTAIIIEFQDLEEQWELRIESKDGRDFRGSMRNPGWESDYTVEMELWEAPGEEQEWLLLGVYRGEDEEDTDWAITLWAEDSE